MKIHLHIDRLILDGVPEAGVSEADLRSAVVAELSSFLCTSPLHRALQNSTGRAETQIPGWGDGGDLQPQSLGQQIGLAVYRGISR